MLGACAHATWGPQKTADFGHQESASVGRFRLGSAIPTVPKPLHSCIQSKCLDSRSHFARDRSVRVEAGVVIHMYHARRTVGITMALPTTERLLWHCGEHTAKPNVGVWTPIAYCQTLLFSVARGYEYEYGSKLRGGKRASGHYQR